MDGMVEMRFGQALRRFGTWAAWFTGPSSGHQHDGQRHQTANGPAPASLGGGFAVTGQTKAPAEAGAFIAAGFANRKGIFHARFPALP